MSDQPKHNDKYYLLLCSDSRRSVGLLTSESWYRTKYFPKSTFTPRFTSNIEEAVQFQSMEDAHAAFRECAPALALITMPVDCNLRSINAEEAVSLLVAHALTN